jgi:dihydroorotase-like cyclic amidohydrolase
VLDPLTAVARFTTGPGGVRDVGGHGGALIAAGAPPTSWSSTPTRPWTVDARAAQPRRNTPFEGRKLTGKAVHTLLRRPVHAARREVQA